MTASLRRGACPSLSAPMETGDGLLVRLAPASGQLSPHQLAGIAEAAQRHGSGLLEVTRRGNLQIRGLSPESTEPFADDISTLDISVTSGVPVEIGPLGGIDAQEIADPRPLAAEIRARATPLSALLGPKVSVTVDGGGRLHLGALLADVKLTAVHDGWQLAIGGNAATARVLAVLDATKVVDTTMNILQQLAERGRTARARDLPAEHLLASPPLCSNQPSPVGIFPLKDGSSARGFALAFGQIDSTALCEFARALNDTAAIRLAPGGGLIVTGLATEQEATFDSLVARLGLVTRTDDPRLSIVACAGAPACRSAWVATRSLAAELASHIKPHGLVHLSGCAKGCARPSAPAVTLTGTPNGCVLEGEAAPVLRAALIALGNRYFVQRESA